MNITDILEESPNGFQITKTAPKDVDEAIRYYLVQIKKYSTNEYPVEYGIANYGMGKLLLSDYSKPKESEERAKRIENALYHFNLSIDIFNQRDYPIMFAIISIMMGKLFRERAMFVSNRSFLSDRSTSEDSIAFGIDQILEAFPIFFLSKQYIFEHAICSLEAGWLYVSQSEFLENFRDDSIREQAATYLERTISLSQKIAKQGDAVYSVPGQKEKRWDPLSEHFNFPEHIQLLMEGNRFSYLEGCALYLLGRLYQGWIAPGIRDEENGRDTDKDSLDLVFNTTDITNYEQQNMEQAFEYYCKSLKPKYLPNNCEPWADAHHRTALLLIKYPKIVNPDYTYPSSDKYQNIEQNNSDIHLEMALQHLKLTLRSEVLTDAYAMDVHFHLAQCAISRLQLIIDKVPQEKSVTRVIREHSEGLELVQLIEEHLQEALQRVTPASSQTTQDSFLYFFSCLKISEYRMLEAACKPSLESDEREVYLADSVSYLIDALIARPLIENSDLHYIASIQLSQLLLAVKRNFAATKSYSKSIFALSLIINRSTFCPDSMDKKLFDETSWQIGECLSAGLKDIVWNKLHFGPVSLNEKTTAGYASWSFEEMMSKKVKHVDEDDEILLNKKYADSSNVLPNHKASPPKGVPPLNLPVVNNKRVYLSGEQMTGFETKKFDFIIEEELHANLLLKKKPPSGTVPLFALGHNPTYNITTKKFTAYLGPYSRRMRRKIPPIKDMIDIDRNNVNTFGFRNGRAIFLLPAHIKRITPQRKKRKTTNTADMINTVDKKLYNNKKLARAEIVSKEGSSDNDKEEILNQDEDEIEKDMIDNDSDEVVPRTRSKSIRPNTLTSSEKKTEEIKNVHKVAVEVKKSNVFSWIFGRKKKSAELTQSNKKFTNRSVTTWLFGDSKVKKNKKQVENEVGMWASRGCFQMFMILSRQTRMELIIRCSKLQVLDGERVSYLLFRLNTKILGKFYDLRQQLMKDCAKLIVPPMTLKELNQRSNIELKVLFKSQVKINRNLGEFEELLYNKISKDGDGFLPFVALLPVFLRDLTEFDSSLLNAERLISNMSNEDAFAKFIANNNDNDDQRSKIPINSLKDDKSKFSYDSVSSAAISKSSGGVIKDVIVMNSNLSNHQQMLVSQERDEKEGVSIGKMTLSLSQSLDGSNYLFDAQQGSKDMLNTYLTNDECIMLFDLPSSTSRNMQVILIWRDNSFSMFDNYSSQIQREKDKVKTDKNSKRTENDQNFESEDDDLDVQYKKKGIIMEVAKSDIHTSHMIQYIQAYLDALHIQSEPMKLAMCTDALRALSCALSLTEFMHMIPNYVRSLVICCPSQLRLIPWHLLLIEQNSKTLDKANDLASRHKNNTSPIEIHLCEMFCVRLGPSLALFELNAKGNSSLRQSVGLHRLCAIDGETGPDRLPGVRGTDLEIACISQTWSADPTDSHILTKKSAVPKAFQTGVSKYENQTEYLQFKQAVKVKRRNKVDHMIVVSDQPDFVSELKSKNIVDYQDSIKNELTDNTEQENVDIKFDDAPSSSDDISTDEHDIDADIKSLTMCRVLHIAALKFASDEVEQTPGTDLEAAIILPRYDNVIKQDHPIKASKILEKLNYSKQEDYKKFKFTSKDIIKQLYVNNCALCVISHYDLINDLIGIQSSTNLELCDANCEFIEALHLAGAKTVLHPLWNGVSHGISTLAHLVFQVRFYSNLPTLSKDKLSIIETCRNTQLWLRDVTADEVISFIHKAPIPNNARKIIIDEMDSYVTASLTTEQKKIKEKSKSKAYDAKNLAAYNCNISPDKNANRNEDFAVSGVQGEVLGNRIGGDQKFFNHFLYWGSFVVSGSGGGVHHPDLTIDKEEGHEQGHISFDDKELNNMDFEASVLRLEGKIKDAVELEKIIRQVKRDQLRKRIDAARATGARASRGIIDTLDYFDKNLLDQDSDEVSVSDDSEKDKKKTVISKELKARESDSDEYDLSSDNSFDDDDPLKKKTLNTQLPTKEKPKFIPRVLDLGSMKSQDVGFNKWKSKVSSLDMAVREPVLPSIQSKTTSVRNNIDNSHADSYGNNKIKDTNLKALPTDEIQEDYNARMERLNKKKLKDKSKRRSKAANDGDDDDFVEEDEENLERNLLRKKQLLRVANENNSDDSDDNSLDSGTNEDGIASMKKKKMKQNEKEKIKKTPTRLMLAFKEIRSNVRSYSDVVKTISKVPEEKLMKTFQPSSELSSSNEGNDDEQSYDSTNKANNCIIS